MPNAIRITGLALLFAGLVAGSPVYAEPPAAPAMMQGGGDMPASGMEGMMGMMEQMNKMMGLCTKMMEGMMTGTEMEMGSEPAKRP